MVRVGPLWYVAVGDKSGEEYRQASEMGHDMTAFMETSGVNHHII